MKIKLIVIGKIKEAYLQAGINEYLKRLSIYTKIEIIEINEVKLNDDPSEKEIINTLDKEAILIEKHLNDNDYLIVLDVQGTILNNEQLVAKLSKAQVNGYSTFTFIIGSSHGLADSIKKKADLSLSFSKLTFTHQMIRLLLLEQIYRSFKIMRNEPYHK